MGFAVAGIALCRGEDELEVAVVEARGEYGVRPGFRQKVGTGVAGKTAELRASYLTNDIRQDPYYITPSGPRSGSALGVPLLHDDELLGVLYTESDQVNAFLPQDQRVLETLAAQVATALVNARLYARARSRLRDMTALQAISQAVTSSLVLEEIIQTVIEVLRQQFCYTYVSLYFLEDEVLRLGGCVGYTEQAILEYIPITQGVIGRAARTGEIQFIQDTQTDVDFIPATEEIKSEISIPLVIDNRVLGILNVETGPERTLDETDVNLLSAFAGQVTIAIENAQLFKQVQRLAVTDSLTGLHNRRHFFDLASTEFERARRYNRPVSILLWDTDHFKRVNDTYGHVVGDQVLRIVAQRCRENLREVDILGRYGGEEFIALLPETDLSSALQAAERLRLAFSQNPISVQDWSIHLTISIGVASLTELGPSLENLLSWADQALLTAKETGRDRVFNWPGASYRENSYSS
jgi:diguanylate cyclase (GGDEF)-like protein